MSNGTFRTRLPVNEPVLSYAPGTPERSELKEAIRRTGADRSNSYAVIVGWRC